MLLHLLFTKIVNRKFFCFADIAIVSSTYLLFIVYFDIYSLYFTPFSSVSIVNFEQVNANWVDLQHY